MLIVGGSGFIGRHLVRRCLSETPHVVVAGHRRAAVGAEAAEWVAVDLADAATLGPLRQHQFEYVFNLGGYIDHTTYLNGGRRVIEQHLIGVFNLVDAVRSESLKGFVQIGSSDEYGDLEAQQREDRLGRAISPYALAKQSAGLFIQMLAEREGFPGVAARLFLVYGPEQEEARFLPQIIAGCLRGDRFAVTPGEQLRDFCYVSDIADALVAAAHTPAAHCRILNIGSGEAVTVRSMIERVVGLIGRGVADFGARPYRAGESMALVPDMSLARRVLGWSPTLTLDQGLARTIDYYRERITQ